MKHAFSFHSIATVHSCYKEKFGIPRQSGLSENADSTIELQAPYNHEDYIREIEGFSHIWLVFIFHRHLNKDVKPTVRPPRLGGNKRIGVFASRSPFRPNPIGISVVELISVEKCDDKILLHIQGADLLDGTPVLDIKPYVKYADSPANAFSSYAEYAPEFSLNIIFSDDAEKTIRSEKEQYPKLRSLIKETISLDPRPAYADDDSKLYGLSLYEFNIKWKVSAGVAEVLLIESV